MTTEDLRLKEPEMRRLNSAYVTGKIIEKIGPILAIKSEEFNKHYVAENIN